MLCRIADRGVIIAIRLWNALNAYEICKCIVKSLSVLLEIHIRLDPMHRKFASVDE